MTLAWPLEPVPSSRYEQRTRCAWQTDDDAGTLPRQLDPDNPQRRAPTGFCVRAAYPMNSDFRRHAIDGGFGVLAQPSQHIRRGSAPPLSLGRVACAAGCPEDPRAERVVSAQAPGARTPSDIAVEVGKPAVTDREVSQSAARRRLTPDLRRDR